jgi:hypothetical protein
MTLPLWTATARVRTAVAISAATAPCYTARMDYGEFSRTAPRIEDESSITFDLRPFGNRQGEVADWFLHEQAALRTIGIKFSPKLLVLVCDAKAEIPDTVNEWLSGLSRLGSPHRLQLL